MHLYYINIFNIYLYLNPIFTKFFFSARYVLTLPKTQMFLKNTSTVPISIHLVQALTSHPRQHRTTTLVPLMLYNAQFVPEFLILRLI